MVLMLFLNINLVTSAASESSTAAYVVKEGSHGAVITKNGDLYCWGYNYAGQVGNGTEKMQKIPVKVLENVVEVSIEDSRPVALTKNGDLYCWGYNSYGQVGNGSNKNQLTPIKVLKNVESFSVGSSCTMALTKNGDLYSWGWNYNGQIGNGSTKDQKTPIKILENVASFSKDCMALTKNGDLYCWGTNDEAQVGNGTKKNQTKPVKILGNVVSYEQGAALTKNGDFYRWGANGFGQVGNGSTKTQTKPVKVLKNVTSFFVGESACTAAITKNGDLYCWGWNLHNQLGDGTTENRNKPVKIMKNVKDVFLHNLNGVALKKNGDLYYWGWTYWSVGEDQKKPQKIMENVKSVYYCEESYSNKNWYALTETSDLYSWGDILSVLESTLYYGDPVLSTPHPKPQKMLEQVAYVRENTAITKNGDLYRWGDSGEDVGNGKADYQYTPTKVLENVAFACETAAITKNGDIYSWGSGGWGQIGNGEKKHQWTPVNIYLNGKSTQKGIVSIKNVKIADIPNKSYTGKALKPAVSLTYKGKKLKNGTDYKVFYENNKDVGIATVTIMGKGKYNGVTKAYFKIVPSKPVIAGKVVAKSNGFTVKWKKQKEAVSYYEIQYATDKDFTENLIRIEDDFSMRENKLVVEYLEPKQKYYIRIRAHAFVVGEEYNSDWSKVSVVKTK